MPFDPYSIMLWIMRFVIVLIALTVHEYAHGYIAYKLGDPTAKAVGRLSLNPLRHLNPIGFLSMLFFGFGWATPVPIYPGNFKNPKRGMALSALAGPVSNLLLALVGTLVTSLLGPLALVPDTLLYRIASAAYVFFYLFAQLNISLAIFNLVPVPPLDGSRVLSVFLPHKAYFGMMRYERQIGIGFFLFMILDDRLGFGILDRILGTAVGEIYNTMTWLWNLLPFIG